MQCNGAKWQFSLILLSIEIAEKLSNYEWSTFKMWKKMRKDLLKKNYSDLKNNENYQFLHVIFYKNQFRRKD